MTKEEKKDELKNKISMALKDPTLQQGFEIICRELADLQKEVIDLRRDKEDLIFVRNAKADHILELKEQIEKMKCCGNCKHFKFVFNSAKESAKGNYQCLKDGDNGKFYRSCNSFEQEKWELRNCII